jgi:acyl carrier protein
VEPLEAISVIVRRLAGLQPLTADEDLYEAGLGSLIALDLLADLEATFAIRIPDDDFIEARTLRALCGVVTRLRRETPPC